MNQAMKQRLVGTLVLGCLAIILAPLLLDGNGIQPPPLSAKIPPAPQIDNTPIAAPQRPVIASDKLPVSGQEPAPPEAELAAPGKQVSAPLPAFNSKESEPAAVTGKAAGTAQPDALETAVASVMARGKQAVNTPNKDAVPGVDTSGLPLSYVVRLGIYSDRKNADALVKKLVDGGHKAYARASSVPGSNMTVVYAGPVLTKAEASSLTSKIAANYKIKGVVETFSSQPAK